MQCSNQSGGDLELGLEVLDGGVRLIEYHRRLLHCRLFGLGGKHLFKFLLVDHDMTYNQAFAQ